MEKENLGNFLDFKIATTIFVCKIDLGAVICGSRYVVGPFEGV